MKIEYWWGAPVGRESFFTAFTLWLSRGYCLRWSLGNRTARPELETVAGHPGQQPLYLVIDILNFERSFQSARPADYEHPRSFL